MVQQLKIFSRSVWVKWIIATLQTGIVAAGIYVFTSFQTVASNSRDGRDAKKQVVVLQSKVDSICIRQAITNTTIEGDVGTIKDDIKELKDDSKRQNERLDDIYKILITK